MELVGDDDDGLAVSAHTAQNGKELVGLLGGEHGGGLIQDQDVRPPIEDLDNLYRLLLGDGHVVNLLGGVDVKAVAFTDGAHLLVGRLPVQLSALLQAQDDVLRGSEHVHQLIVLVDHADAVGVGVLGRADGHRLPAHIDLSLVGEVDTRQHVHQRCLAAAVLPQQGEDFPPVELEVDAVVGHNLPETLGDAF